MRTTGRPVGLLMWHGRHAWVMSGFRATADPLLTDDFKVTSVIVEDPLYPYGSKVWGPSPRPGEALTPKQLGRQFVPRRTRSIWNFQRWAANLAGKYVHGRAVRGRAPGSRGQRVRPGPPVGPDSASRPGPTPAIRRLGRR